MGFQAKFDELMSKNEFLNNLNLKINKYIPSVILLGLILVIIIALVVFLVWPKYSEVNLVFKSNNAQLVEDFDYTLSVNGKEFKGSAILGQSKIQLPKGDIKFKTISLNSYEYKIFDYDYSQSIVVSLQEKVRNLGVSIYLFNADGSMFNRQANLSFSCNSTKADLESKVITNGYLEINVPSNCGRLIIDAQADGYNLTKGQNCDSLSCSLELTPITYNFSGNNNLPSGSLKVKVLDELGNTVSGANVKVYDYMDSQYELDSSLTNLLGQSKTFNSLTVGKYTIEVSYLGYLTKAEQIDITENNTLEKTISIYKSALGNVALTFTSGSKKLPGSLIVKDSLGKVLYRADSSNGNLDMPIYSFDKYYLDYLPLDKNYFPVTNHVLELNASTKSVTILIKEVSNFEIANINIRVIDEDSNPVENARVFLVDELTQFDLLSYRIKNTDLNGETKLFSLKEGLYKLRVYNGFSESYSNTFSVVKRDSGDIPEIDIEIQMIFGYSNFDLEIFDQYNTNKIGAEVSFYKKPNNFVGTKLTDTQGKVISPFKAGNKMYYTVKLQDYMPYYSESRLLLTNYIWEDKVYLEPEKEGSPRMKFLGVFDEMGKEDVKTLSIGGTYYLGLEFSVYDVDNTIELNINFGDNFSIEQEKFYAIDIFTSANTDIRYSNNDKNITLGDAKIINSKWIKAKKGVYRVYYKVKVRDNSSVKLYDPLKVNWNLKVDDVSVLSETKEFLVGSKVLCYPEEFCSRYYLLDLKNDLYLDSFDNSFTINTGKDYSLNFDLINGISGVNGEINSGYLQIYNALSPEEGFSTVKDSISQRSFIELLKYNLVYASESKNVVKSLFGVYEENFSLSNFFQNKYVTGDLDFRAISQKDSYINFLVVDNDRKVVVNGKPALSILFNAISQKEFKVSFFPDKVLAPESTQNVKVLVKDDSNSFVSNAIVSFKLKNPKDSAYKIYPDCKDILTNQYGEANCILDAKDLLPGTYIQIIVQKDGFNGYSKKDFSPDLTVSNKIFDFDTEKLELTLTYPSIPELFRDLGIINNTAKTIVLDNSKIKFSNYSQDVYGYLNFAEMQKYLDSSYNGKEILGRELVDNFDYPEEEAKTILKKYFKAALQEEFSDDISESYVNGFITLSFKTEGKNFDRVLPFIVNLKADGSPSTEPCLFLALNSQNSSFASDGKSVNIPLIINNSCNIELSNEYEISQLAVEFENLYGVLNYKDGSLNIGNYIFNSSSLGSQNLVFSVPKVLSSNFNNTTELVSQLTFTPSGNYGSQNLTFKLFGTVKTSQGLKKIESNEISFDMSVININDCIKVFYAEKEISELTLTPDNFKEPDFTAFNSKLQDVFTLNFKNVCNIPLKVSLCKDSSNKISQSCGEEVKEYGYVGFEFDNFNDSKFLEFDLTDSKEISVYRPQVSGAYALEVFVKQNNVSEVNFKRTKFLPINIQTTQANALFSDNPFLQTNESNSFSKTSNGISSDILRIYNTDVPSDMRLTNKNIFIALLNDSLEASTFTKPEAIKVVGEEDLFAFENKNFSNSYGDGTIAATSLGAALGATTTIILLIAAANVTIPVAGWIVAGVAAVLSAVLLLVSSLATINDWQESRFLIIDDVKKEIYSIGFDTSTIDFEKNYDLMFSVTGQNQYIYKIVKEFIEAKVGMTSKTWTKPFKVSCDGDYFVESFMFLDSSDKKLVKKNDVEFENCSWEKDPEVSQDKKTVTFYPKCGGDAYSDPQLETYVVVACKLDPSLWSRASLGGIKDGYPNVGQVDVQFNNINFANFPQGLCNAEWCFKVFPIEMNAGLFGNYDSAIRVAFKNPKDENITYDNLGLLCTDASGNVIGFTGEDAKPKVDYEWENLTENYCSPDNNDEAIRYCDSTQFLISGLKRLDKVQDIFKSIDKPSCPYKQPYNSLEKEIFVSNDNYKLDFINLENTDELYLSITYKEFLNSQEDPNYILKAQYKGQTLEFNTDTSITNYNNAFKRNTVFISKTPIISLPKPEDESLTEGDNILIKENIDLILLANSSVKDSFTAKLDLNAFKWAGGCIITNPSTDVLSNGRMTLFNFYDEDLKEELEEVQDLLHYRAYLMNDGFSEDFLNDFVESILYTDFLNTESELLKRLDLETKIKENRFKILNPLNQRETMGPGLYGVHFNIVYSPGNLDIKDANIEIRIEKIRHAENDNVFYYIPLNGRIGLIGETNLDRQNYGVEITGENILFDEQLINQTLIGNYSSTSTPKASLNVSKDLSFEEINGLERGTILNVKRFGNNFDFRFVDDLTAKEFTYGFKNKNLDQDTGFVYRVNYNSRYYDIALPWVIDGEKDFTGSLLPYTLYSQIVENNRYGVLFPAVNVVSNEDLTFKTIVYAKNKVNVNLEYEKVYNKESGSSNSNPKILDYDSVVKVFNGINNNKLCISNNSNNNTLRVFVNESNTE